MKNREKFNLRLPLFLWNMGLCLFSCMGVYMAGSVHFRHLYDNGVEASICGTHLYDEGPGVWGMLFCLSKAPELIDTIFIVLRKQKLIFLHWYHHVTVFIYCWYNYCLLIRTGQWFIAMNYVVHSIMYGYYCLRISRLIKLPIWVNMVITILQLLQMVVGVAVNLYVYMRIHTGWECDGRVETTYFYVLISFAMYFSYFILFASFFYDTYLKKPKGKSESPSIQELKPNEVTLPSSQFANGLRHRNN